MEGALNLDHLRLALGEGLFLPSPEELQRRLADAEVELFLRRGAVDDDLLATAWYLHAVGTTRVALDIYPVERQLRANQVSAHIFDLALSASERGEVERHEMTFAAQVGYLRGGLHPNAVALYRQRPPLDPMLRRLVHQLEPGEDGGYPERPPSDPLLQDAPGEVSLDVGSALVALDRRRLFPRLDQLRSEADQLRNMVDVTDLIDTPYGAAARVVEGCFELLVHLTYDRPDRLERARQLFDGAVDPPHAQMDLDSRWVAAHLRDIADDLSSTSIWAHRPPSVPPAAAKAMTLGDPAVLSLWPPQLDLLKRTPNPLEPDVRRLLLSFPTSAGKTLIAQYLVAAHVAAGAGSACVVVPTHSLGRELQRDLDRRLGTLGAHVEDAGPLGLPLPSGAPAVVMTPEKLAAHLRNEPERLLNDFSLFLIDEAHLLGDTERGWVLESALGFLHGATRTSHHRIILLSAALGNRAHVSAWLSLDGAPAETFHHDWRGPRRAHALFGTDADWDRAEITPPGPKGKLTRQSVPLHGTVHIRTGPNKHRSLRTTQPIGAMVRERRQQTDKWKRSARSDPQYRIRARMATALGAHGSVLIVEPTKQAAQRTAVAVADELQNDVVEAAPLVALATTRLGSNHPLIAPLRRGVGFHHAALPDDIQAELEDGIRNGILRYLVATTTLIEGINFPVRSVLIGERGYRTKDGFVTTLDAPKLLNAIGRSGRAGRETEGWVVLALTEPFTQQSFAPLTVDDSELTAVSRLSTTEALDALAAFEALLRQGEDAIMEAAGTAVADFISHVWFIADALDELRITAENPVQLGIESTLAWQQLTSLDQNRWRGLADLALRRYEEAPEAQRRRWARTGTSLNSASRLETIAGEVRTALSAVADRNNPVAAFRLVSGGDRLERLLDLREGRFRAFRPRRNAPADRALAVDIRALIVDWLQGRELDRLGETHLSEVSDESYRYEQLSEFISSVLEHFLPWLLSTVVAWVNEGLDDEARLCPDLPAYVRHGVDRPVALELARAGVRSRRLAHVVAGTAATFTTLPVQEWLAETDVRTWGVMFDASPSELADLLFFTRARDARITSRVLAGETIDIALVGVSPTPAGPATLQEVDETAPARVAAFRGDRLIGYVGAALHDDVSRLLAVGVPLTCTLTDDQALQVRINDPADRAAWFPTAT